MARRPAQPETVNLLIVGQMGRLAYEALLFALSLRRSTKDPRFKLHVAEPQPGPKWKTDPAIRPEPLREMLAAQGATILPFESRHFGSDYPHGNKIEALFALPKGEPFVFFDTDTLVTGDLGEVPFDFSKPAASMRVEGTWPQIELYGPGYTEIWQSLYDRFGLEFQSSLDLDQPDEYWRRYLYFNAGFFYYSCPHVFGQTFLDMALSIWRSAARARVPAVDPVAGPDRPASGHPFVGGRARCTAGGVSRRGHDGALPQHAAALCPRKRCRGRSSRRDHGTEPGQATSQGLRAVQADDLSESRPQGARDV